MAAARGAGLGAPAATGPREALWHARRALAVAPQDEAQAFPGVTRCTPQRARAERRQPFQPSLAPDVVAKLPTDPATQNPYSSRAVKVEGFNGPLIRYCAHA